MNFARSRYIEGDVVPYGSYAARKQWAKAIYCLLLPLLLIVRLTMFQRQRSAGDFAAVDTFAAAQVAIVGAIWVSFLFMARLKPLLNKFSGTSVGLLMLFYAFCGISALWSPLKAYSLYRAIEVIGVCLMVFAALDYLDSFERAERLALGVSMVVLVTQIVARGMFTAWRDMHANTYPMSAAMILCYCMGEVSQTTGSRRRMLLFCALVSFVGLCAGTSSSANIATLCGLFVIGIVRKGRFGTIMIFMLVAVLLLVLTGWMSWIQNASLHLLFPGKSWDTVASGHGRLALWQRCWPEIAKRPLLGHGFAASARIHLGTVSAHNTFVGILLDTGIIGLALFGLSAVVLLSELRQMARSRILGYVGCSCVFASAIVGCMGTAFLGTDIHAPMVPFASFAGLYALFILPQHPQVASCCKSSIS